MENIDKVLGICSVCKSIRLADASWLKRDDNSELYDRFIKKYEGRLSHTYCPEDLGKAMKEAKEISNNNKKINHENNNSVWPLEMPPEYIR